MDTIERINRTIGVLQKNLKQVKSKLGDEPGEQFAVFANGMIEVLVQARQEITDTRATFTLTQNQITTQRAEIKRLTLKLRELQGDKKIITL